MIKKFVTISRYLLIGLGILVGIISCEDDLQNIGVDIVDNDVFHSEKYVSEVIAYSKATDRNQTNGLSTQLFGVQRDPNFGKLKASIVSQLLLSKTNPDYGTEAVIDTVILDIPFSVTLDGTHENGSSKFIYDKTWTSGENKNFQLNVFELGTYLDANDPINPSKEKAYFSDDVFVKSQALFSGEVTPDLMDTLLVVNRYKYPNYPSLADPVLYKKDTIQGTITPSIKIPLNEDVIKSLFQDYASGSEFASTSNFQHHFKGLYLEALEAANENDAAMMSLDLTQASVKIYYSNTTLEDEGEDEDLDGDGVTGETNVTVHNPEVFSYKLSFSGGQLNGAGVKVNLFERDFSDSEILSYVTAANSVDGEDKLYTSGALGSNIVLKLFGDEDTNGDGIPDELELLRTKNWLINDAILTFYVDESNTEDLTAESLFIYNIGSETNTQIYHSYQGGMGGLLETDGDETDPKPVKYSIHIVDYINEIIKPSTDLELLDIGIKAMEITDLPLATATADTDTTIKNYSNNQKGVVLKGNLPGTADTRIKLEIYYSEKN